MTDDLVKRANYALNDMQGRVGAGKLAMFQECIARVKELEDKLDEQEERIEELEAACEVVSRVGTTHPRPKHPRNPRRDTGGRYERTDQ